MLFLFRALVKLGGSVKVTVLHSSKYFPSINPISSNLKLFCHWFNNLAIARDSLSRREDYSDSSTTARSNWLITKLSREGRIHEAAKLFDEMPDRDVVTWTTVITGYIKCGLIDKARNLFDRVDAKKNVVTWTVMVSGYLRSNRFVEAERLFDEMPVKNVISWNTMIGGCSQNGEVDKALQLFDRMPERNVVTWNTMITALAQCGRIEEAVVLFDKMPERDVISWTSMVGGLAKNKKIDEAREVFDRMPERNIISYNAMITGYAQNTRLIEAFELFSQMPERDLPSWNTMITGFIQNGEMNKALDLFSKMPQKNVISWTTMITGFVQNGQSEEALKVFSNMVADNSASAEPNQGTFVSVLSACSDLAGFIEGQQIHQMISKSIYQDNTSIISALINMYSKCGELSIARKMFDDGSIKTRDLISWNNIISAYAHHGRGHEAIKLFNEMQESGFIKPDDVTYVALLSACNHAGLVDEGMNFFEKLVKDEAVKVREDHYACLVDLCGRAGKLHYAIKFIEKLKSKPSALVWGALLAGCNVHGDVEIGKVAAKELLEIEPENAGTYMLLSNIFASNGKWREALNLRVRMKENGIKKQPGCSWIEIGSRTFAFVAGDKSHFESKLIYCLLVDLHAEMRKKSVDS